MLKLLTRHRLLKILPLFVVLSSIILAACLTLATWRINFWPTDAEDYYISTAVQVPNLKYVSQMHQLVDGVRKRWLHGKEMFFILSAVFQKILKDYTSLRPLILVCILATCFSAALIFFIAKTYWGNRVGLACFLIFTTSFWPYVYILFVRHQSLGLFYFLLALFFLCHIRLKKIGFVLYSFSGFCLCLSIHSSSAAGLYIPYYLAGFLYSTFEQDAGPKKRWLFVRNFAGATALCLAGFLTAFLYFNYPNIAYNVRSYLEYADISRSFNHFFYNQPVLKQWVAHPELNVRGGWVWIIKYFFLIMPVLFPVYLFCFVYLVGRFFTVRQNAVKFRVITFFLIILSLSSPLLAEGRKVAQYGANYFTSLAGIIMLVGYALFVFWESGWFKRTTSLKRCFATVLLCLVFIAHVAVNAYMFFTDIYPSRMVTTFLSRAIEKREIREIYTYLDHPCRINMVDCLDPKLVGQLKFILIRNIYQIPKGYILVPPVTGYSIYMDVTRNTYADFDRDIYLAELFRRGNIKDYAVASFRTLSGSRIWSQEEEVLSYKCLILNQCADIPLDKKKVWLLDAEKLQKDRDRNLPSPQMFNLIKNGTRNVGTKTLLYIDEGRMLRIVRPVLLQSFIMRAYKVGEPQDGLVTYVYRLAQEEPVWIPFGEHFASDPVPAKGMNADPRGQEITFKFPKPILLVPGGYRFVTYRTGQASDKDFYRIDMDNPRRLQEDIDGMRY